jgi:uncharacterized protein
MEYKNARFRFFGPLNDFLPPDRREIEFSLQFQGSQSAKHLFESCGAPHVEVAVVTANGETVESSYLVQDGDGIEVRPFTLPVPAARPARFVLDNHLGKLAAYLRLVGFDIAYRNNLQDPELAQIASLEQRILLTRDRRLLMRAAVRQGYCVRSEWPRRQVVEILERYGLFAEITFLGRCVHCNTLLEPVTKQQILERLQPLTRQYFDEFQRCPGCDQVYWQGSHVTHIQEFIEDLQRSQEERG